MTEIDKMFENVGINKIGIKRCSGIKQGICQHNCNECESFDYKYPPFTAEKQLNIIKLISKQGQIIIENWEKDNRGFNVTFRANSNLRYITMVCITRKAVEDALAQIINDIWQDLTDQEKDEIRGILNV